MVPTEQDVSDTGRTPVIERGCVPGQVVELERAQSMLLMSQASYGRVVFTRDALPAIRPVHHAVQDDRIILRTRLTSWLTCAIKPGNSMVVAYEADDIDPAASTGWAVVVTGLAHPITDPVLVRRYERVLPLWLNPTGDAIIAIEPSIVTGVRLLGRP